MMGYEKILVPLDGSAVSEQILPQLEKLAMGGNASIHLVRVAFAHTIPGADPTEAEVAVVREAEDYLAAIAERLGQKGLQVETHVRYGHDADEILDHCDQYDIDLIAMSTHGRSGVKRWMLGSVAEKIIRHATKPILLIRSKAE
jgi:nucleotide-binding universal stress UspA family protein